MTRRCSRARRQGSESVRLMYLLSIARAAQASARELLLRARRLLGRYARRRAKRGVNRNHRARQAHRPSRPPRVARALGKAAEAGVEIHEYQPTMYHCKVMVVDGLLGFGRVDQLRQPLVPPERRSQPQHARRGSPPAGRDLRGKTRHAVPADHRWSEWRRRPWTRTRRRPARRAPASSAVRHDLGCLHGSTRLPLQPDVRRPLPMR